MKHLGIIGLATALSTSVAAQECNETFDGTFDLIQTAVFERNGCTTDACHGSAASGGLDLSPEVAYANLIDAEVESVAAGPAMRRVVPAKKEESLLWINLAAATLPGTWSAPLRAMPLGGLPPLSFEELELIRLWIENGAPENGTVDGTAELVDACLPPTRPLETQPLDPPPAGTGIQFRAPTQILVPQSEREVCFITYYDITDQVPEEFRGPSGDTFRYNRIAARQDPLSHHAVLVNYTGAHAVDSPVWGSFTCGGGTDDGATCDPTDPVACDGGVCASTPQHAVGCYGFGPGDASIGFGNESLFNTMAAGLGSVEGIYAEAPLKGILIWNSHAFNVTDEPGKLDIWVNLDFAAEEEQVHELQRFTVIERMFALDIPPFEAREICGHYAVPPGTDIIELSSHNHKRGLRFQTFEGAFHCADGANAGDPCSPIEDDETLGAPDLCAGAACIAYQPPAGGDCDGDLQVRVEELVTAVGIALGTNPHSSCRRADLDGNGSISIAELVVAVRALLEPRMRDVEESTIYTNIFYADPAVTKFDPSLNLGDAGTSDQERTLTYCGLFENGVLDPATVKRKSTSPPASGIQGNACREAIACAEGRVGDACSSDTECDTAPGAGDGACDACTVGFGTTTDDEMFILLGASYRE